MIVVLGPEKRRRRSVQEKTAIVQQSFEPRMTLSPVSMALLPVNCSCGVSSIRKAVSQPLLQEIRLCPRRSWHLR